MFFSLETVLIRLTFTSRVRQRTYKKLARQVAHGIPFYRAVAFLHETAQRRSSYLAHACERILDNNARGGSLMQGFMTLAGPEELLILGTAEQENLSRTLMLCHDLLMQKGRIRKACLQSMIYPCFLIILLFLLMYLSAELLVPQFATILPVDEWQGAAEYLAAVAAFLTSRSGICLCLSVFCLFLGTLYALPRWTGRIRAHVETILPFSIYRIVVGTTFLETLATQMRCGIQPRETFQWILTSSSTSAYLRERVRALDQEMARGKNLGQAFLDFGFVFPSEEVIDDLQIYAELPDFQKELSLIAREELELGVEQIQKTMKTVQTVLLFAVVVSIMGILSAIFSLQNLLGNSILL